MTKTLYNDENVWGDLHSIKKHARDGRIAYGNAVNINGNFTGLYGDLGALKGCCSGIRGPVWLIAIITSDLDILQDLLKQHNLDSIYFYTLSTHKRLITVYRNTTFTDLYLPAHLYKLDNLIIELDRVSREKLV